jgi:hypothetical protein
MNVGHSFVCFGFSLQELVSIAFFGTHQTHSFHDFVG